MSSAICFNLDQSKLLSSGNGLNVLYSLPDKFYAWSKLKAFADDNVKVAEMVKFFSDRRENIVGKGENSGFLFPQSFQRDSFPGP